ncbi:hypothetical protein BC830DRAFT_1149350 [Chytriomyces sp. MP71]|nr:hypothetical protein BC830DRAFT_1149350 [Chytriomyces sp. MP71]
MGCPCCGDKCTCSDKGGCSCATRDDQPKTAPSQPKCATCGSESCKCAPGHCNC